MEGKQLRDLIVQGDGKFLETYAWNIEDDLRILHETNPFDKDKYDENINFIDFVAARCKEH